MKILVVHPSVELYGADKILLHLLSFMSEKHEVTLLVPQNGVLIELVRENNPGVSICIDKALPILHSKLRFLEILNLPIKLIKINKIFKKNSFDIVYCNTLATGVLLYTHWSKKKIIHVHEMLKQNILNLCFSILIFLGAQKVICVSNHVKDRLFFSKKYSVLYNGIPDEKMDIDHQAKKKEKINFVLPGRIMPQKGQWFLLDAIATLPLSIQEKLDVHLFGSPPPMKLELLDALTVKIENMNLQNIVQVHSFCTNINEIYSNADIILVPSIMSDPFPTTVLEAMMFSKPLITTNHGGASEIVKKDFGILINPGDTKALAEAISFYVVKKDLLLNMGQKGRNEYEVNFTIDIFKKNFYRILNQFMKSFILYV